MNGKHLMCKSCRYKKCLAIGMRFHSKDERANMSIQIKQNIELAKNNYFKYLVENNYIIEIF